MRLVFSMVAKDLLRKSRSPLGFLVLLLFPVVFSVILAVTFGGGGEGIAKVRMLVENRDDGPLGNALVSALISEQLAEHFEIEAVGEEGAALMEKGKASALLRIPKEFSRAVLDGEPVTLDLVRNPAQGIFPEIAEQVSRVLVEVLDSGARVLRGPLDEIAPFTRDDADWMGSAGVASVAVSIYERFEGAEMLLFPPAITFGTGTAGPDEETDSAGSGGSAGRTGLIFLEVLPGVAVWALFMIGIHGMRDLLAEQAKGTLRRQLAGPISGSTYIVAKALYAFVLCLVSMGVLSVTAWAVYGGAIDPAGFVLLSLALVLAATGSGAAIYGATGSETRGSTVAWIVYLILGFASGSFLQLDNLPRLVQTVAPVSPFYWGTEGFKTLLKEGGGVAEILAPAGMLAALGAALLILGSVLLNLRVRRGGTA